MAIDHLRQVFSGARDRALAGTMAAALAVATPLSLSSAPAQAADANSVTVSHTEVSPLAAQRPTAARPYYYMRFDAAAARAHPGYTLPQAVFDHAEKLVVINFIDEGQSLFGKASRMQSQVLRQSLGALAGRSEAKELMLIEVVVTDAQGRDINIPAYGAYVKDNTLGPDGSAVDAGILPYGVVMGDPLREGAGRQLFDFALLNGVKNDADLNANVDGITSRLLLTVDAYNERKVAALESDTPVLAAER